MSRRTDLRGCSDCRDSQRVHIHYYYGIRSPYGLLGPNSIIVVYMDSLGLFVGLKGFAVKDFMRLGIPCRGWVVWGCKA